MYLTPTLDLVGEIISNDGIYFIQSSYRELRKGAKNFTTDGVEKPSLFILESANQRTILIANQSNNNTVSWQPTTLSFPEQTAQGIFLGILNTMRFEIGNHTTLSHKKNYIEQQLKKEQENALTFLIDKDNLPLPHELLNEPLPQE